MSSCEVLRRDRPCRATFRDSRTPRNVQLFIFYGEQENYTPIKTYILPHFRFFGRGDTIRFFNFLPFFSKKITVDLSHTPKKCPLFLFLLDTGTLGNQATRLERFHTISRTYLCFGEGAEVNLPFTTTVTVVGHVNRPVLRLTTI